MSPSHPRSRRSAMAHTGAAQTLVWTLVWSLVWSGVGWKLAWYMRRWQERPSTPRRYVHRPNLQRLLCDWDRCPVEPHFCEPSGLQIWHPTRIAKLWFGVVKILGNRRLWIPCLEKPNNGIGVQIVEDCRHASRLRRKTRWREPDRKLDD